MAETIVVPYESDWIYSLSYDINAQIGNPIIGRPDFIADKIVSIAFSENGETCHALVVYQCHAIAEARGEGE